MLLNQQKTGPGTFLPGIRFKATKEVKTFQEMCLWDAAQWERGQTQNITAVRED